MIKNKKFVVVLIVCLITSIVCGGVFAFLKLFEPENEDPGENEVKSEILSIYNPSFENRIYVKNSGFYGDEKVKINTKEEVGKEVMLTANNFSYFNTDSLGKKLLEMKLGDKTRYYSYYVADSLTDTRFNCLSKVVDFYTTYYVGESLNLTNATIELIENIDGYMVTRSVPLTSDMITGFDTSSVGSRTLKISYGSYSCDVAYHVKEREIKVVTANSFTKGIFFSSDTTDQTEHFIINIKGGTYVYDGFKEIIEKVYAVEEEVTGLKFKSKITIELTQNGHPGCGGSTVYINASELYLATSTTFAHELAHALDHGQDGTTKCSSTITEGFAQYVEFLTTKRIEETDPELATKTGGSGITVGNINVFKDKMHYYDFETRLLYLKGDELSPNSRYETGARFLSYLNHRYGDFCGWLKNGSFSTADSETWKSLIKQYYNNQNVFAEFHNYEQMLADNRFVLCDNTKKLTYKDYNFRSFDDLCGVQTYSFYFNLDYVKDSQGYMFFLYKDLYLSIDSAREQLYRNGKIFTEISLKTNKNIKLELYKADGQLLKVVTNTSQEFSLKDVSFIKFVGTGIVNLCFNY